MLSVGELSNNIQLRFFGALYIYIYIYGPLQVDTTCERISIRHQLWRPTLEEVKSVPTFFTVGEKLATIASTKNQLFAHRPTMKKNQTIGAESSSTVSCGLFIGQSNGESPVHVFQRPSNRQTEAFPGRETRIYGRDGDSTASDPGRWSIVPNLRGVCRYMNQWRYINHLQIPRSCSFWCITHFQH